MAGNADNGPYDSCSRDRVQTCPDDVSRPSGTGRKRFRLSWPERTGGVRHTLPAALGSRRGRKGDFPAVPLDGCRILADVSIDRLDHRRWIAPASGRYCGLSKDGRIVPRPPAPPTMPAATGRLSRDPEPAARPTR